MKSKLTPLLLVLLTWLFPGASTHAVKVDQPGQAERESSHIVTGTVAAIYSRVTQDASYQWTHCVATVRVDGVEKGDRIKPGEVILVKYIGVVHWIGKGQLPPGPGPHLNVPGEGHKRKICLTGNTDGAWEVYYVSGFQPPDKTKAE